ncbi:MAG TPA: hypothetical protein VGS07_27530 [Thermoanaerobaculia bacterium]|jgi:hypothetical protein|nr:hypothetical protein [Thermoanaerobaculia bacterium]
MRIILPGAFSQYRGFVSEDLPNLVYQTNMDSKVGGKMLRTALKTDRFQNWKIISDAPTSFEAAVFLGKSSNRLTTGYRRILVKATEEGSQTVVDLSSVNKATIVMLVGFLFCLLPGILFLIVKIMNDGFERRVIAKVGTEVKNRYPEAILQE